MPGGIQALKGFEYQATVTLDVLLRHYGRDGDQVYARPEGHDDLVLRSSDPSGVPVLEYIQIKKPRETGDGRLTGKAWSLADVVRDLLPGTLNRLTGNQDLQVWVLGDEIDARVGRLLAAGASAPTDEPVWYANTVHLLARNQAKVLRKVPKAAATERATLKQWRPPRGVIASGGVTDFVDSYAELAAAAGVKRAVLDVYRRTAATVHKDLPHALGRIHAKCTFGTEEQIRERVRQSLTDRYKLEDATVRHALLRNLRGFIQDVATQADRWIDRDEFELELRSVWPRMNLVADPPSLDATDLRRELLAQRLVQAASEHPIEVTGISGSGKTRLASAILAYERATSPDAHTFYVEVRREYQLRDVLSGLAFHLRRFDFPEPFAIVTRHEASDENALRSLTRALSAAPFPLLVLIDLVEGTCSDAFAKELAIVIAELRPPLRVVAFGQESPFRGLRPLERRARGLPDAIDLPGCDLEEFIELVSRFHAAAIDRTELSSIFEQVSGGRSAGLFLRLADTLARCSTLEQMQELVNLPPDEALAHADRARYLQLPEALRRAADCLVCFALPFRLDEAESIFAHDRVADAARELTTRGLLRQHDTELLEMHEAVRAGLERLVPPAHRKATHGNLAAHYLRQGNIVAAILHFERAERIEDAHREARQAFVAGRQSDELAPYVAKHRLLPGAEVIRLLAADPLPPHPYLLPKLLESLDEPALAEEILRVIRDQASRFDRDYRWAWFMTEAVLACDPTRLRHLVAFGLESERDDDNGRLSYILHAARRSAPVPSALLLEHFAQQTDARKAKLVPLMLLDPRREVLGPILSFVSTYDGQDRGGGTSGPGYWGSWPGTPLLLRSGDDATEFLAALPLAEPSEMILFKSVLLGRLETWVWGERSLLLPHCISLLEAGGEDEVVLENALRSLLLFGDARAVELAESYVSRKTRLGTLAAYAPVLMPSAADTQRYREQLLDGRRDVQERSRAFSILTHLERDLDRLFGELSRSDPENLRFWELLLVMAAAHRPCKTAIPLLEAMLRERDTDQGVAHLAPCVAKMGELHGTEATEFLVRALEHPLHSVRVFACMSLQMRRAPQALDALLGLCRREPDTKLALMALVAAIASHPTSMTQFQDVWPRLPGAAAWRCVLAGRLRAASEAKYLLDTAADPTLHWQLRRAAILAAGQLPFDNALSEIAATVLKERSPFSLDENHALLGHDVLAWLVLEEAPAMRSRFVLGRQRFVSIFADVFEMGTNQGMFRDGVPSGEAAANWLFDRFVTHGWPGKAEAPNIVLRELHVPILHAGILRGLRRSGRRDLIEQMVPPADSLWLLLRVISEWQKETLVTPADLDRISKLADRNALREDPCVGNILRNMESAPEPPPEQPPATSGASSEVSEVCTLRFHEIHSALQNGTLVGATPLVLLDLTKEQVLSLSDQLAPARDYSTRRVVTTPRLRLTAGGFTVQGTRVETGSASAENRARLRPALVAANAGRVRIPWHRELLLGGRRAHERRSSDDYLFSVLACFAARGDRDGLYEELNTHADLMFPRFDDAHRLSPLRNLLDARVAPFLRRYANAGTDGVLESLCWMAACVDDPAIDPVLAELFLRWTRRLRPVDGRPQRMDSVPLWRSFRSLTRHPRFQRIPDHDLRIVELLHLPMSWYHKRDLVEAVGKSPRTYMQHEMMLLRAAPFEHFFYDEVDRLDDAADRLFSAGAELA